MVEAPYYLSNKKEMYGLLIQVGHHYKSGTSLTKRFGGIDSVYLVMNKLPRSILQIVFLDRIYLLYCDIFDSFFFHSKPKNCTIFFLLPTRAFKTFAECGTWSIFPSSFFHSRKDF